MSPLVSSSSPLCYISRKAKNDHHIPPASTPPDIQRLLSKEIHDHAWEFKAERIAEMLSATSKAPSDILANSAHEALKKKAPPTWPTVETERTWYPPIGVFLNDCVDACHDALDGSPGSTTRNSRWYNRLTFIAYDRTTEEGVDGVSTVEPGLVGGLDLVSDERVAWSPQNPFTKRVLLPVEVKAGWAPIVLQAATYALRLFGASPSRLFAVVLGFQHVRAELRFLVFHRGGLTGSRPLSVKDERDQKDILRVLLSLLNWKSSGDAGFLEFYNAPEKPRWSSVKSLSPSAPVRSPIPETNTPNGDHAYAVVKHTWCEGKCREVEADTLSKCEDDLITLDHRHSFCPADSRGLPMSTARFLPTDDEQLRDFHWAISPGSKVPSHPQHRHLLIDANNVVGRSLMHAKTPWELCIAVGHGMLGWLSMLREGFLHGDINAGSVLMFDPPVTMKSFEVRAVGQLMTQLSLQYEGELAEYANLLEDTIKKLGFSDKCHGFVMDRDTSASLEAHFTSRNISERYGTFEFMSNRRAHALRMHHSHIHSPVDDIESFYYTILWATAFNDGASGGKHNGTEIQHFRDMIAGDRRELAVFLTEILSPRGAMAEYGQFFAQSLDLLALWRAKYSALSRAWSRVRYEAAALDGEEKQKYLGLNFLNHGYRGVGEYLELVHEHRASLQGTVEV